MNVDEPRRIGPMRTACSIGCILIALFLLIQLLGLLFIESIADSASDPNNRVRIPLSVRCMGVVADILHDDVLDAKLDPDGSNWPRAFRWFFILEMCGLAGLIVAFTQLGCAVIAQRMDWFQQSRTILFWSFSAMIVGFLLLLLIDKDRPMATSIPDSTAPIAISSIR